ncbi:MAG: LamG-like jellyroll fold domain-containing protein, partial [Verrucomicrobiales bacterium]
MKTPLPPLLFPLLFTFSTSPVNAEGTLDGAFDNHRVLLIGIDGVRSDAMQAADTPNMDVLSAAGAVSYDAFAGGIPGTATQQVTSSGPGWSSILAGVWTNKHGVTSNSFSGDNYEDYPHFFRRVKEVNAAACTASIVQWSPIDTYIVGAVDAFTDHRATAGGGQSVADQASAYLAGNNPDVLMLHFDDVDHAGHGSGYSANNSTYLAAIAKVDDQIGEVIDAIEARPNFAAEDWLIIITTDHGGLGTGHGGQSADERTIFFIASGGAISKRIISPGPGHTAPPPTAFRHLGIAINPAWGWESEPFGFPPFCLDALACTTDPSNETATLSWSAPEEIDAAGIRIERDGTQIATLPLDATTYIDSPPLAGAGFSSFEYTVHTYGGTEGDLCPVRSCTAEFFDGELTTGLIVHLKLDGDTTDSSGQSNNAAASGAVTYPFGGVNQYAQFNAGGEHISLGSPASLNFGNSTDFSVSLLLRSSSSFTTDNAVASNKDWASGSNPGWVIAVNTNGSWQWNIGDGSDRLDYDSPGGLLYDGSWHHVTAVHDRDGSAQLYFDGELVSEHAMAAIGNINALATALATDGTLVYPSFPGCVDEFRIWRRKLLPEEVAKLHSGFAIKRCPTSLTCVINLPGEVTLSWNSADNLGATGFEILRDGTSIATLPITATTFSDSQAGGGNHTYTLRVLGEDAADCPDLTCVSNTGISPEGLIAYYDFNSDNTADTSDALGGSASANDGSWTGSAVYKDGAFGRAVEVGDGAGSNFITASGAEFDFGATTSFTVVYWLNTEDSVPGDPAVIAGGGKNWSSTGGSLGWVSAIAGDDIDANIGDGSNRGDAQIIDIDHDT